MNLKDYREKELKTFVIANILMILCFNGMITFDGMIESDSYMLLLVKIVSSSVFASIIYTAVIVCDCMIPDVLKKIIVFWWSPMPGETIFSDIKSNTKDSRFTSEEAIAIYSEIINNMPEDKKTGYKYQNSKWYELYRKHENEAKVLSVHKDFLMCRDMANATIIMMIVYFILSVVVYLVEFDMDAVIYLIVIYFLCMCAARVKSKRFINTVIACDIHSKK